MNLDRETLGKIIQVLKNETKIQDVFLFGSRAKGCAKKGSDIDLVVMGDDLSFRDICRLGMKLDELDLPYHIDIVHYNSITSKELKDHIDRVGISLKDLFPLA